MVENSTGGIVLRISANIQQRRQFFFGQPFVHKAIKPTKTPVAGSGKARHAGMLSPEGVLVYASSIALIVSTQ
jgi:hypothetical protein